VGFSGPRKGKVRGTVTISKRSKPEIGGRKKGSSPSRRKKRRPLPDLLRKKKARPIFGKRGEGPPRTAEKREGSGRRLI